jgi:hypothetical protein
MMLGWLYIFAGFDGTERLNDMWRIKLTSAEPAWEPVEQKGDLPPPLCNCPVTLADSKLYLFSGKPRENGSIKVAMLTTHCLAIRHVGQGFFQPFVSL